MIIRYLAIKYFDINILDVINNTEICFIGDFSLGSIRLAVKYYIELFLKISMAGTPGGLDKILTHFHMDNTNAVVGGSQHANDLKVIHKVTHKISHTMIEGILTKIKQVNLMVPLVRVNDPLNQITKGYDPNGNNQPALGNIRRALEHQAY